MKKLLFAVLFVLLSTTAWADKLNFTWDQPNIAGLTGWSLYWSDTSGGPYSHVVDIPIGSWGTTYTANGILGTAGTPGAQVTKYFVLRSVAGANESGNSNEVTATFTVPIDPATNLVVTVIP